MGDAAPVATATPIKPVEQPLRILLQGTAFIAALLILAPLLVVAGLLPGRRFVRPLVRAWGRTMLAAFGVRLVVEPAAAAECERSRRRVLTINHASTLDLFVATAFWPPGATVVMKREFLFIPIMGQLAWAIDAVAINRKNRASASAALSAAAKRVRDDDRTIIVAPEGTRSRTGELQPFKLGAFHLAAAAEAPIVPIVMHGNAQLWPLGQVACSAGTVTVRLLPEEPPPRADDDMHARAERLHASYKDALASMDAAAGRAAERPVRSGA